MARPRVRRDAPKRSLIYKARMRARMTQYDLGEAADLSVGMVSLGERKPWKVSLAALERLLGVLDLKLEHVVASLAPGARAELQARIDASQAEDKVWLDVPLPEPPVDPADIPVELHDAHVQAWEAHKREQHEAHMAELTASLRAAIDDGSIWRKEGE